MGTEGPGLGEENWFSFRAGPFTFNTGTERFLKHLVVLIVGFTKILSMLPISAEILYVYFPLAFERC